MKYLTKYLSIILLFLSLLLFSYVFFRSEILLNGQLRNSYYIFYYICGILIILSIIVRYLANIVKIYFVISIFSLTFSFYLFETYLFINYEHLDNSQSILRLGRLKNIKLFEKETKKKYDTRMKITIFEELNKKKMVILLLI